MALQPCVGCGRLTSIYPAPPPEEWLCIDCQRAADTQRLQRRWIEGQFEAHEVEVRGQPLISVSCEKKEGGRVRIAALKKRYSPVPEGSDPYGDSNRPVMVGGWYVSEGVLFEFPLSFILSRVFVHKT